MIPKVIHYCWFGYGKKNRLIRKCIDSWSKNLPDYEVVCWNEENFNINSIPFVKEAYEQKKWAFVADYVRLYALFNVGGIYLDTDSEVYKSFDVFLNNDFFAATDSLNFFAISAGFIGSCRNNSFVRMSMEYYENTNFILDNGRLNTTIIGDILASLLEPYGYRRIDETQTYIYKESKIVVYSTKFFIDRFCENTENIYAKHWGEYSWGVDHRGKVFKFFKKNDIMFIYEFIERVLRNIQCISFKHLCRHSRKDGIKNI